MASPQKENGYTAIANEILERLCLPGINGSEFRILNLVIRKTYGYNKKQDYISLTQFQKGTLMDRKSAVETIKSLVGKNILVKDGSVYRFNKNWETWVVGKRPLGGQKPTGGSGQKPTKSSGQLPTYKRNKDIDTKDIAQSAGNEINQIISLFQEVNPSFSKFFAHKSQRDAVNRMLSKFGREKVESMIAVLPQINAKPYWPKSTTPIELENNLGKYKALNDSEKVKREKRGNQKIFKL